MARTVLKGGAALRQKLDQIAMRLDTAGTVRIGFLEGATYSSGESVALVAAINEFGAPSRGQPPRPYFRRMIAKNESSWGRLVEQSVKLSDYNTANALGLVGMEIKGELQQSIVDLRDPPLAKSTIQRKGSDKPLIDQGVMLNSVDFEVE